MKTVLAHIMRRKHAYSTLPLFARMRDARLSPQTRLSFMPGLAFFVMAFGDLNRYVLREEPASDAYQQRVNVHTYEDDHHWPWFLEDLETLGWNGTTTTTDALRALWSDDTHRSRILMYDLCAIATAAQRIERLAVIEAIEETGNVLFSLTTQLADMMQTETNRELRYMGAFHLALESGHLQNSEHAELAALTLQPHEQRRCIDFVDRVFDTFTAWTHEAARQIDRAAALPAGMPSSAAHMDALSSVEAAQ